MANPKPSTGFQDHPENINRKGRPPKGQTLTEVLLSKKPKEEIADLIIELLNQRDPSTLRFVYNHIDGLPKARQEISTPEGEPFQIILNKKEAK
jgi:hypothetical protein